jgi:hypothetical protein
VPKWPARFQRKTRSEGVWTIHGLQRQRSFGPSFRRELGEASGPRRPVIVVARPASGSVRPMGDRWQARVTHLGRQIAVGTFATRREALDAVATARLEARDGRFIAPSAARISFDSVVERWWQTREGHRPSTRARDRMVLDHDVLPTSVRHSSARLLTRSSRIG